MITLATWNIERLKHKTKLSEIAAELQKLDADILVLTEYDLQLELEDYPFKICTAEIKAPQYSEKVTERRVIMYSKHPILEVFETYDPEVSCCAKSSNQLRRLDYIRNYHWHYGKPK